MTGVFTCFVVLSFLVSATAIRKCHPEGAKCNHASRALSCCDHLHCKYADSEDRAGVCVKSSCQLEKEGCGGLAGRRCCKGLHCIMTPPFHPDQMGLCVSKSDPKSRIEYTCSSKGEVCGGNSSHECCGELECKRDSPDRHQLGTCIECQQMLGEVCGKRGLTCCGKMFCNTTNSEEAGTCAFPAITCRPFGGICGGTTPLPCCDDDVCIASSGTEKYGATGFCQSAGCVDEGMECDKNLFERRCCLYHSCREIHTDSGEVRHVCRRSL